MGNVEPIRKDQDAQDEHPGIDVSFVVALDEKRTISGRTMFAQDTPCHTQEKILARWLSVCAVTGLRERILEEKKELANARRRLSELNVDPVRQQQIESEIEALGLESTAHAESEERKFRTSGRQGNFRMEGAAKRRAEGIVTDIEKKKSELKSLKDDIERQRAEIRKAISNFEAAIANKEAEVSLRRETYEG